MLKVCTEYRVCCVRKLILSLFIIRHVALIHGTLSPLLIIVHPYFATYLRYIYERSVTTPFQYSRTCNCPPYILLNNVHSQIIDHPDDLIGNVAGLFAH